MTKRGCVFLAVALTVILVLSMEIAKPSAQPTLTVSIAPSKPIYVLGEKVSLEMNSNVAAEYHLIVRRPDGSVWASAQGYLPVVFTKVATEPLGTYTAELLAYYGAMSAAASASFMVTPDTYDVIISLAGLPTDAATMLQVDGDKVADMRGGDVRVLWYAIGTSHTFQVDQYVNGAAGYRYYCASNTLTANAEGSYTFDYAAQVYLDVSTDPTGITDVTPSGWYALGSSASISPVPGELGATAGVRYAFSEWTLDGIPRAGNGFVVVMDAPHKVVARFDTITLSIGLVVETVTQTTSGLPDLFPAIGVLLAAALVLVPLAYVLGRRGAPARKLLPCSSCGHQNPPTNQFCGKCGHPLRDETRIY